MLKHVILTRFLKNKLAAIGFCLLIIFVLAAIFAPFLSGYGRDTIDLMNIESQPSLRHLFGTDELGRDVFTRLLYGGRISLGIAVSATVLQLLIGVTLGCISGFYGGWIDNAIMRIVDTIMCFPFFVIAITVAALAGPSVWNVILIIGLLQWTGVARIVRAEILSIKQSEFIEAARAMGLNSFEIIINHLLPNTLSPVIVNATLAVAQGILMEAGLSFLGLGVKQPEPSWGNILSAAQSMRVLQYEWWLWIPAGVLVFLSVLSINFVGDGLRDALDPKMNI
ncbi:MULTISPECIES: oligopeptide ABC transporter permease [Clostridium]|uniref:Peptide/nickel transport system permease protein n=1 Tax=Clostridium beijerinckii TaxID=1520 RepID=A0A9Q5GMR9_CLOBE|nr:oligopeptide ABC transporter permease [Clostridium beijerinckii]AQS06798.1 oligopeptide transport system permease protein OppC [Clostridium beijerinckii]MBA2883293.1 peptide/nickel transport system permease protein [Clostridium beijerinckii]MBA2898479.1 peptide/nickel transport system permease protein [Clostridium beijerinckii]MBA2907880.1 peptide/nickel transport system permease protein [Clostridium beijerinckii]MBA9013573.1 peptide/nickel transport system permease protein [Clostridium bei